MLIWSSLSVLGLIIAHRTLMECETLQIFSVQLMKRIRVFIFLTLVTFNFLLKGLVPAIIVLNIVIFLSPWLIPFLIEKKRESTLKMHFIPIVDSLILSMKSGKGFRPSLHACMEKNHPLIRHPLAEFMSAIQYQKEVSRFGSDPQIHFFFQELAQIDQSQHRPMERLKAMRRRILIEKNFRQKSRQALLQVRFQSWVITALYSLLLIYVHHDFGFERHWGLISGSLFLFSTGLIMVQRMGRSHKWKI